MRRIVLFIIIALLVAITTGCAAQGDVAEETPDEQVPVEQPAETETEPDLEQPAEMPWWLVEGVLDSELFVEPVDGMTDDFIRGADISSLLSLETSGTRFYGFDRQEQDMLLTLSQAGFNYIRVRIWNDPFDSNGNGYGGGNCTAETAALLGARAAEYGMKLLVNFHYSDFWADPGKQQVPKAWEDLGVEEKAAAIYEYTQESLAVIVDGGADVGMVQIGNETTTAFCGEGAWPRITQLMAAGAQAVRDFAESKTLDIQIAIHLTNPESRDFVQTARLLENNGVDYDIFASSYYPFWHGTLENLAAKLGNVAEEFGKKVIVAEVAYAYSWEDFDGHENTIGEGAVFDRPYPLTVQGQATAVRDVVETVVSLGDAGLGVFYWEPAWIPVPGDTWEERSELWERYGSGWASSFATEYDPEDAGVWYGGSACDNQALFDASGYPLPSLNIFGYCFTGAATERRLDEVANLNISVRLRNPIELPETTEATYNDGVTETVAVEWNVTDAELEEISNSPVGVYAVYGTAQGMDVTCFVKMEEENYLENPSLELEDRSMWVLDNIGDTEQLRFQEKTTDAHSGNYSVHFWDDSYVEFTVEQTVTGLREGEYSFTVHIQGGDVSDDAEIYIYAIADGVEYRTDTGVDGWVNWQIPVIEGIVTSGGEITVGVYVRSNGGWGTMDDFMLNPMDG